MKGKFPEITKIKGKDVYVLHQGEYYYLVLWHFMSDQLLWSYQSQKLAMLEIWNKVLNFVFWKTSWAGTDSALISLGLIPQ